MYTQAQLCNLALDRIGTTEVLKSLGDNTIECEVCLREFPGALTKVLSLYPWGFARKRAVLARLAAEPPFGYSYAYQLPPDFLSLVRIEGFPGNGTFEIEDGKLLCDEPTCRIVYCRNGVDPAQLPPHVAELLVVELARRIVAPLRNSARSDVQSFLQQLWQDAYPVAMAAEMQSFNRRRRGRWLDEQNFPEEIRR